MPERGPVDNFTHTLDRVVGLIELTAKLTPSRGHPLAEVSDVLRGAVVLAAAALDELVLGLVAAGVPHAARQGKLGPAAEKWLKQDAAAFIKALEKPDPAEELGAVARRILGDQTFQKARAIEGVLHEALGAHAPWEEAAKGLSDTSRTWAAAEVREALDRFIERRHRIAHDGDRLDARRLRAINRRYVRDGVRVVLEVGLAADRVVRARLNLKLRT